MPITHVTNGVHVPTWLGPPMKARARPPPRRRGGSTAPTTRPPGTRSTTSPTTELWARPHRPAGTASSSSSASGPPATGSGEARTSATSRRRPTASTPTALTIGFARRLATYKRLHLLTLDPEPGRRPAHRRPAGAVRLRRQGPPPGRGGQGDPPAHLRAEGRARRSADQVAFLEDYDLSFAAPARRRAATSGSTCPRPPEEASGTSGMKAALNGGAQPARCSTAGGPRPTTAPTAGPSTARPTPTTRPRTAATPPPSTTCSRARSCPCSTTATPTACPAAWLDHGPQQPQDQRPPVLGHPDGPRLPRPDLPTSRLSSRGRARPDRPDAMRRPSRRTRTVSSPGIADPSCPAGWSSRHVAPQVDAGRFPVKRVTGEEVEVTADVFADGHDTILGVVRHRPPGRRWAEVRSRPLGNDRWTATFPVSGLGLPPLHRPGVGRPLPHRGWPRPWPRSRPGQDVAVELADRRRRWWRRPPTAAPARTAERLRGLAPPLAGDGPAGFGTACDAACSR